MHYSNYIKDTILFDSNALTLQEVELCAASSLYFKEMSEKHSDLYSKLLFTLMHEKLTNEQAEILWDKINMHMRNINEQLQRHVGIKVAAVDYLSNFNTEIATPVIIDSEKYQTLKTVSTTDDLTQLYSREVFNAFIEKELERYRRFNTPLSLILIDIDNFKSINDVYGHSAGDTVLKNTANLVQEQIRSTDIACRFGGDEFIIILPNTNLKGAIKLADTISTLTSTLQHKDLNNFHVTLSIGVSSVSENNSSADKLIEKTDTALYEAKSAGKNTISS